MAKRHYWYSKAAHDLMTRDLYKYDWRNKYGLGEHYVQVTPDGKLSTFNYHELQGVDEYMWPDKVYVGCYDSSEVKTVEANLIPVSSDRDLDQVAKREPE